MRLGEIKNKLAKVTNDQKQIVIQEEQLYGGQAYIVKNYNELISAFEILAKFSWNDANYEEINNIIQEHGAESQLTQLPQAQFNQLSAYVSSLNQKFPLYFSILETMVETQDEQVINLKLPDSIDSLKDLTNLNGKLESLFKKFVIDGEFKFEGFDKGTNWYEICITGIATYPVVIACLKVAQQYCKMKKEYYDSEKAKLDYQASLKDTDNNFTKADLKEYVNRRLHLELMKEISNIVKKVDERNGHSEKELESKLVIATKNLVEVMGDGVEFHLSLNPPQYAKEEDGRLIIDYKKMSSLKSKKEKSINQIPETLEENKQD